MRIPYPHHWAKRYMYGVWQTRDCKRCGVEQDRLFSGWWPGRPRFKFRGREFVNDPKSPQPPLCNRWRSG